MNSDDMVRRAAGLTYRKLDHWCHKGIFGDTQPTGSGGRRQFSEDDLRIAQILGPISVAFDQWTGRGGCIDLYREVARQLRDGIPDPEVRFAPGLVVSVRSAEVVAG